MRYTLIVLLALMSIGCRGVNRLLGQQPQDQNFDMGNINPDDYFINGKTVKDHDSVHFTLDKSHKVVSVEILEDDGSWYTLQRPDSADYLDSYQVFKIPSTGVYFGDLAYKDANGMNHFEIGTPSAPTGTTYRIHIKAA